MDIHIWIIEVQTWIIHGFPGLIASGFPYTQICDWKLAIMDIHNSIMDIHNFELGGFWRPFFNLCRILTPTFRGRM